MQLPGPFTFFDPSCRWLDWQRPVSIYTCSNIFCYFRHVYFRKRCVCWMAEHQCM